ncbi:glycosyl hydrolase 53 family protein [uncultured Pseudokineococcus sp.]|uniref:glycosyl hydrolase 53 family protein n=1 Tax=uncultured Pseudokineococcus sp. TaxID=1642928 RepID=UPI00261068E1|nr:glycosyl hydrolase 53 family protein [uncultured Pseudokineococcus sp.]
MPRTTVPRSATVTALAAALTLATAGPVSAAGPDLAISGDLELVPGQFVALDADAADGTEIASTSWSVDSGDVVEVDRATGRVDALGVGSASVTVTATGADGAVRTATAQITVTGGPDPLVAPVPELQDGARPDFIMGADVSSLADQLAEGKRYYGLDGREAHPLDVLAEQGVNYVRLRVWVDPRDPFGNAYGGGNSDVASTIELARAARARGMGVNVVFHYSDFWAHPGQQVRPKAWADLTGQALADAVGDFTADALVRMRDAGVYPDMVTVGNETNSDIVEVPYGLTSDGDMDPTAVAVFQAGAAAVRATDPDVDDPDERALVSLHLANGNNTWLYDSFARAMERNDVDYDALGASYYPSWHGTLDEVQGNLDAISERYDKLVYVAETAYPWTLNEDVGDDTPGNFTGGDVSTTATAASVQGQATMLRDVLDVAASVPGERGLGVFYWEPAWLPGPTTGWATPYGTGWEAAGLFDINGHALPSVRTYSLVRGDQQLPDSADEYAYGWETQVVAAAQGEPLVMPETVVAVRGDGLMGDGYRRIDPQPVVWDADDVAAVDTARPGEHVVHGDVGSGTDNVFAQVVVRASPDDSAAAPTFSLPDGAEVAAVEDGFSRSSRHVVEGGTVEVTTATPNASVHLTLDGADPRDGAGSTRQLVGSPWIRPVDSIRVAAGPVQVAQNVEVRAIARRTAWSYDAGRWGSSRTLLQDSPEERRRYRAVYDYDDDLLLNGGFETGDLTGWELTADGATAGVEAPQDWVTGAYAGDEALALDLPAGGSLRLEQRALVPDGTYALTVRARGDDQTGDDSTELGLTVTSGGVSREAEVRTVRVPGGSMIWREYRVEDVEVVGNELQVAFHGSASEGWSGRLDHVVLHDGEGRDALTLLRDLTGGLLRDDRPHARALLTSLEAAQRATERGREALADRHLDAFERRVEALTGRVLDEDEAAALHRRAEVLRG